MNIQDIVIIMKKESGDIMSNKNKKNIRNHY